MAQPPAHPLARYLEQNEESQQEFADRTGLARSTISRVLNGERKRFSPEASKIIVAATKGKVTLEQCLGLDSRTAA